MGTGNKPINAPVEAITIGEIPREPATIVITQNGKSARLVVWQLLLPEVVDLIAGVTRQALTKKGVLKP